MEVQGSGWKAQAGKCWSHIVFLGDWAKHFCTPGPRFSFCSGIWVATSGVSHLTNKWNVGSGTSVQHLQGFQNCQAAVLNETLMSHLLMPLWVLAELLCLSPLQHLWLLLGPCGHRSAWTSPRTYSCGRNMLSSRLRSDSYVSLLGLACSCRSEHEGK